MIKLSALTDYLNSWTVNIEILMGGILFGGLFGVINTISDRTSLRRKSFGYIILVKSVLYFFSMVAVAAIIYETYIFFEIVPQELLAQMTEILSLSYVLSLVSYMVMSIILLNFIMQVDKKFGPGNLFRLITGKYHRPRDENRIFMFLDLSSSTTIAEKLGHNKYSQLLQNCYHDLTDVVVKYRADIYQYVGDEVVLSWSVRNGLKDLNCLKAFFAFENSLSGRKDFYLEHFETLPEFKAGMDMGYVTVAEIGDIKRDIAYHGDVLNTASRIQGRCKKLNRKLLISGNLEKNLTTLNGFSKESIGEVNLRGKEKTVNVYSLS